MADLPGPGSGSGPAGGGEDPAPAAARLAVDLRPGRPDLSSFPRTDWASSVRRALSAAAYEDLDYAEPAGLPVLRAAVADYVTRARGVRADAGAVVITAGFTPGLALLGRVLHRLGMRTVATEDPGLGRHRDVLHAAGLATVPLEVGPTGADPDGLAPGGLAQGGLAVRAVVLTPAHQYPRGVVLGARKRSAFADWARREDGFIVEDDYDGEFRYDQQPVGAMQALAPDRVVFAGSTSKTLAPGMRLGWLVVPPALRVPLLEVVAELGAAVPAIQQLAMADLIGRGGYDRHIRRMRLAYRRRRAELARVAALEGVAAGLHALLPVESAERERVLIARGRRAGVALQGLHADGYWREPGGDRPAALIIGYAASPPHAWSRALEALAEVVQEI
ncbi:MAG TPA: PLP-dependent aminotransferase family protein [Streptosporangiaceae bacterium]|nr:PLP-dependent aminotransferase family protein [Streptosporangiaceae bacterium]